MNRRSFIKRMWSGFVGLGALFFVTSCAPLIAASALDKSAGDPWECMNCGHLMRSKKDLTGQPCPRCHKRMLKRITEAEMAEALKKLGA